MRQNKLTHSRSSYSTQHKKKIALTALQNANKFQTSEIIEVRNKLKIEVNAKSRTGKHMALEKQLMKESLAVYNKLYLSGIIGL